MIDSNLLSYIDPPKKVCPVCKSPISNSPTNGNRSTVPTLSSMYFSRSSNPESVDRAQSTNRGSNNLRIIDQNITGLRLVSCSDSPFKYYPKGKAPFPGLPLITPHRYPVMDYVEGVDGNIVFKTDDKKELVSLAIESFSDIQENDMIAILNQEGAPLSIPWISAWAGGYNKAYAGPLQLSSIWWKDINDPIQPNRWRASLSQQFKAMNRFLRKYYQMIVRGRQRDVRLRTMSMAACLYLVHNQGIGSYNKVANGGRLSRKYVAAQSSSLQREWQLRGLV